MRKREMADIDIKKIRILVIDDELFMRKLK